METVQLKHCKVCGDYKNTSLFDSGRNQCKECRRKYRKRLRSRPEYKERINTSKRTPEYRKQVSLNYRRRVQEDPTYREKANAKKRTPEYRSTTAARYKAKEKERYRSDPEYRQKVLDRQKKRRDSDPEYARKLKEKAKKVRDTPENKEKEKIRSRIKTLMKYGLTPEKEKELLKLTHNRCRTCTRTFSDKVILCHDHCHTVGHFRGFLCKECNTIMGFLEKTGDPESTLANMMKFVQENSLFITANPMNITYIKASLSA